MPMIPVLRERAERFRLCQPIPDLLGTIRYILAVARMTSRAILFIPADSRFLRNDRWFSFVPADSRFVRDDSRQFSMDSRFLGNKN